MAVSLSLIAQLVRFVGTHCWAFSTDVFNNLRKRNNHSAGCGRRGHVFPTVDGYAGEMSVGDAYAMLEEDQKAVLVDVRTQAEWT